MQDESRVEVHPFFDRSKVQRQPVSSNDRPESDQNESIVDVKLKSEAHKPTSKATGFTKGLVGKPQKPDSDVVPRASQKTLTEIFNGPTVSCQIQDRDEQRSTSSYEDEGLARSKRRRTSHDESLDVGNTGGMGPDNQSLQTILSEIPPDNRVRSTSPRVLIPVSSPIPEQTMNLEENARLDGPGPSSLPASSPKKMMKLSAGGKLASPTSKGGKTDTGSNTSIRRGRPRKSKEIGMTRQLVVRIAYKSGGDAAQRSEFGGRIDDVLSGVLRVDPVKAVQKKPKPTHSRSTRKPAKAPHPLFVGKTPEQQTSSQKAPSHKTAAITPGKLRSQATYATDPSDEAQHVFTSALLKDRLMIKHPGAREPAWPNRDQTHVRGLGPDSFLPHERPTWHVRKQKNARMPLQMTESVLHSLTRQLRPEPETQLRPDGFREPHPALRLPEKLILTGNEISSRLLPHLALPLEDIDELQIDHNSRNQQKAHPALRYLYSQLPAHLTAFDRCLGATQLWAQKYAPSRSQHVLQPIKEMEVIRLWLQALTVNAVDVHPAPGSDSVRSAHAKPKKKRRRLDELDDFIVYDGEETPEMSIISLDLEDGCQSDQPRSVVQVNDGITKLSNVILLSGPPGCGKSAAAYAVAKELGYRVFEINSSERRTGKDVLNKIGDLTENHIVQNQAAESHNVVSLDNSESGIDAAFQRDLESGRQGKMSAFFKTKASKGTKDSLSTNMKIATSKAPVATQTAIRKPPKDQQQSLILLEEVDVLFKEDKDFWSTVSRLVESSKRPFIMTCNDESLVDVCIQEMSLHARLRLSAPSPDLATDSLLLVAALEGHLLDRHAVATLYEAKHHDFRASVTELQFWCQMGVGDHRDGLSWIYQRWPLGSDTDCHGRPFRVTSKDTYHTAIGLPGTTDVNREDEMILAWHELGIEPWSFLTQQQHSAGDERICDLDEMDSFRGLDNFVTISDALSASDIYCPLSQIDPMLPPRTEKARTQYAERPALLEADEALDYSDMGRKLAVSTALLAYNTKGNYTAPSSTKLAVVRHGDAHTGHSATAQQVNSRHDFACFNVLAPPYHSTGDSAWMNSVFGLSLKQTAVDFAPYVRSIAQYDVALAEQRARLEGILSGHNRPKRSRTTRAARSALEGSQRASTRRERWFDKELDFNAVLATASEDWPKSTIYAGEESGSVTDDASQPPPSSVESGAGMDMV